MELLSAVCHQEGGGSRTSETAWLNLGEEMGSADVSRFCITHYVVGRRLRNALASVCFSVFDAFQMVRTGMMKLSAILPLASLRSRGFLTVIFDKFWDFWVHAWKRPKPTQEIFDSKYSCSLLVDVLSHHGGQCLAILLQHYQSSRTITHANKWMACILSTDPVLRFPKQFCHATITFHCLSRNAAWKRPASSQVQQLRAEGS